MMMKLQQYTLHIIRLTVIVAAVLAAGLLWSCKDDTFSEFGDGTFPEGVTTVNLDMNFEPLAGTVLQGRGAAQPGDAIKKLKDFSILFYNLHEDAQNPTLVYHFSPDDVANQTNMTITEEDRNDADASNGHKAESKTTRVKLKLTNVPYGGYKIYAVANLGGKDGTTRDFLESHDISTPDQLRYIQAEWDHSEMLNNSQMTGYFSVAPQTSPGTSTQETEVAIKEPNMTIHSWLRRLASKITIDYDPSKLRDGVTVTIKKVTVRDIARVCNIAAPNIITLTDDLIDSINNHCIIYEEPIVLTDDAECVAKYPRKATDPDYPHTETANALYFFENMQGEVHDKDTNGKLQDGKFQDGDGDGKIDYPNANDPTHEDYKDNKDGLEFGTYIEVDAEYHSTAINNLGHGKIKYRFMIGKNVTTNCDAERNHHYKLTLRFLGNANEVDWHIDYDEDPGFYGPNPYYVSYLYNRMSTYPIKIAGELDGDVTMTIIQNNWGPNNATDLTYYAKAITQDENGQDSAYVDYSMIHPYINGGTGNAPWYGFLALAQTEVNQQSRIGEDQQPWNDPTFLQNYWTTQKDSIIGKRTYKVTSSDQYNNEAHGRYRVVKEPTSTTIHVPFFTREKQLLKTSGYTGNNPYVSYMREAKVRIDYKLKGESESRSDEIKVYQVRRIVNPTGVWRKHNNATPFKVTLMHQEKETSSTFTPAKSIGPWRAYISRGNTDFITLDGKSEVRGGNGTQMEFTIGFKGTIAANQTRCAVIRVEYHNYSCHHLIFVRQGYAPIRMTAASATKWHTFNVERTSGTGNNITVTEALSPLDEGSMFRYGNLEKGILAIDNAKPSPNFPQGNPMPEDFDPSDALLDPEFHTSDGGKAKWSEISSQDKSGNGFPDVKMEDGKTYKVASLDDYNTIINKPEIDYGYGVLYGDEATATATSVADAYGFCSSDDKITNNKERGMRGVFVYNNTTALVTFGGNNIFFPIGRAGYGHRKHAAPPAWEGAPPRTYNNHNGVLQYGGRSNWYHNNSGNIIYVPLFDDLFRSEGAIYWLKKVTVLDKNSTFVMDVNYRTLDFSIADDGVSFATHNGEFSDAGFVRLVE